MNKQAALYFYQMSVQYVSIPIFQNNIMKITTIKKETKQTKLTQVFLKCCTA